MFNKLSRLFKYIRLKSKNNKKSEEKKDITRIPRNVDRVEDMLEDVFTDCSDFNIRKVELGQEPELKVIVAFLDGMIDKELINRDILNPLMIQSEKKDDDKELIKGDIISRIQENIITVNAVKEVDDFNKAVDFILGGDTLLFIEGEKVALKASTKGWEQRGVERPDTEVVVRGPREGFTENLRTNTTLLRRKIKNPKLKFKSLTLGTQTNTNVCVCYIEGLVHEDVLATLERRLKKIRIDSVLESGYIEEFIEDAPYSIFPTVANSEKPDFVAGKVLEGRAAVLCDGTPFVLTVPNLFLENITSGEDYYARFQFATLTRILRLIALLVTITLPAVYVAMVSFHQDIIPFKLLLTISASREGIPFSAFTEVMLMGVTYELLREAGVRLPRPIGQAVSIVGGLVLGQAAVDAGIASNPVIMITALTAITSFILPSLRGTIPFIRIIIIFAATILGFLGMNIVIVLIFAHMCTLRSFGVPYLAPFSPLTGMDLKDTFVRVPLWLMWLRPRSLFGDKEDFKRYGYRMKKDIKTKED